MLDPIIRMLLIYVMAAIGKAIESIRAGKTQEAISLLSDAYLEILCTLDD